MEQPNSFGLSIAYDPYMREVVQADKLTTLRRRLAGAVSAADWGRSCGFCPVPRTCKPEVQEDNDLNGDYDFTGPSSRVDQGPKGDNDNAYHRMAEQIRI